MSHKIFIAGTGGIGEAAALLLREWCSVEVELFLGDISDERLADAKKFVTHLSQKTSLIESILMPAEGLSDQMREAFEECEVLLDCSPGANAPTLAGYAKQFGMHYANLTEYVAETEAIIELAKDAETGFVLQTGLAPGYINVLAMLKY